MVRFGVMDSMHVDARSIALQTLVRRTMKASNDYSADLNQLIEEVRLPRMC